MTIRQMALSLAVAATAAGAAAAPKFIGTGWDIGPNQPPSAILGMADAFAKTGLDGVVVVMPEMYNDSAMSPKAFTREMAGKYVADLRKFKGKPGLSESLLLAAWSPLPRSAPRLAWTDDAAWTHFAENMRTYAWLAREAGLSGLFIDNEDYLKKRQFWRAEGEPPYAELRGVARRRGAEVGRALFETYPEITCLLYWILTIDPGYTTALDPVAYRDMKEDLWPSFIDGLLDVMPETAKLVDGDEHGYCYVAEKHEFATALALRSRRLVSLLAPENREKYRARVGMGFGQYMDMYTNPEGATYYQAPKNGSRLARFRENLAGALAASDSYVWFYGEKFKWVDWPGFRPPAGWMKIGKETWEQKLPGFAQMLRDAKDPVAALRRDLDARRGTCENLLTKALANTKSYWKADGAAIAFDFQPGKGVGGSVRIATRGAGDGCVLLSAGEVAPGEEYVGEIYVRGKTSRICLCWRKGGAWRWSVAAAEAVVDAKPDADGWRRAILRAVVPPEIDGMVLKTDVTPKDGETVEFSGAAVYRTANAARPYALPAPRPSPDWFRKGVVYQMSLRAFTPEGTLNAAAKRLAHVRDVGASVVYLCPVWVADDDPDRAGWSPRQVASGCGNPRSPYRLKDYDHVDPEYGTDADFKAFVDEAHRLGLRVVTDLVFRHCGPNAVFLKDHPDYVRHNPDGSVRVVDPGFPVPLVNFESRGLRDMLVANMVRQARDFGVDGFRTDMSDSVPLDFWAEARRALDAVRPDLVMIAEGTQPSNLSSGVFDANYGHWSCREGLMPLLYAGCSLNPLVRPGRLWAGAASFQEQYEREVGYLPDGGLLLTFTENHDTANEGWTNRAERVLGAASQAAGLATIFALPGVPMIYNGQEICDASRHSIFGRMGIDWSRESSPEAKAREDLLRRLAKLRRSRPALTSATDVVWLGNDRPEQVVSFARRAPSACEIAFVANLSAKPVRVHVDGKGDFALEPWDFRFLSDGVTILKK